jgi:pantothenate synthetase
MSTHAERFERQLKHLVKVASDRGYAHGNEDIQQWHIRQAYTVVMELYRELNPAPAPRNKGGIIRNSRGQTVNEMVSETKQKSLKRIEALAEQATRIAQSFLTEGNRNMANFYESVAADLREHLKGMGELAK